MTRQTISSKIVNERTVRVHAGGGDESENSTVHEIPRAEAAAWLDERRRAGYAIDPKLYAGLYFIERNPDGSAA